MGTQCTTGEGLIEFPTDHVFKAMGLNRSAFVDDIFQTVSRYAEVSRDALKIRMSSGDKYLSVTVVVRLHSRHQMEQVYLGLRQVEGVHYLL